MKQRMIDYFMDIAERTAELSYANKLKVGALAVKDNRIISIGYNGSPSGWSNVAEDENGMTFPHISHAEENALTKIARSHESSEGATVFCTHSCCQSCAKLIFNAGITTFYYKYEYRSTDGIEFLKKCGVKVIKVGEDSRLTKDKNKIISALGNVTILESKNSNNELVVEDVDGKLHFIFGDDKVLFVENKITLSVDNMVKYLQLEDTFNIESDEDMLTL